MKKTFTVLEMMVYIFIVSVIWLYVAYIANRFFDSVSFNKDVTVFSNNYDAFLSNMNWNIYNWRVLTWCSQPNSISVYKTGYGYIWYSCLTTGIISTDIATWYDYLNWNLYKNSFSWFNCNSISWTSSNSGFWLKLDLNLSQRNLQLNYYLQN